MCLLNASHGTFKTFDQLLKARLEYTVAHLLNSDFEERHHLAYKTLVIFVRHFQRRMAIDEFTCFFY